MLRLHNVCAADALYLDMGFKKGHKLNDLRKTRPKKSLAQRMADKFDHLIVLQLDRYKRERENMPPEFMAVVERRCKAHNQVEPPVPVKDAGGDGDRIDAVVAEGLQRARNATPVAQPEVGGSG